MTDFLFLSGRVFYGVFFIFNGINHLRNVSMMALYAASKGVPAPKLSVLGSGVIIQLGGLSILLGLWPTIGVILVSLFLIPVTVMMHNYWTDTDPQMKMNNQINFHKNLAMLGAAWMFLAIPQPWALSLG